MRRLRSVTLSVLLATLALAAPVLATCDAIPGTQQAFRGALGTLDRPFARPGDTVELRLDPACHGRSPGLGDHAVDLVATILFTPPAAPPHAVVLAPDCLGFAAAGARCEAALGGGLATCIPAGDAVALVERDGARRLRLRFPDTDALFATPGDPATASDGRGYTGPATIAVSQAGDVLPCGLATTACRDVLGVSACVDELYLDDGDCGAVPHPVFGHFTALPPANDFAALCETGDSECTRSADEVRLTVDAAGNLLMPMDWRGVLFRRADVPVPRLLRGGAALEAFEGGGVALRLPDDDPGLGAFSVHGSPLPPIFTPQRDPRASDVLALFGSVDAPEGVLRLARRRACVGGSRDGLPCQSGATCPGGACGPGLFDFGSRLAGGAGPLVLRRSACLGGARSLLPCTTADDCRGGQCIAFSAEVADPVPLDGLNATEHGFAFVVSEALVDADRNGDGDPLDDVVQLVDRTTGRVLPIGDGGDGRAVLRLREPPFTRPALATSGDVVAFVSPEAAEHDRDADADGDRADTVLRVYRLEGSTADDLTGGRPPVADAAPLVDGGPLAVSAGHVFFRTPEAALARQTTTMVSRLPTSEVVLDSSAMPTPQSVSADGRFATFINADERFVPGDAGCEPSSLCRDAILTDRDADGDGRFDELPGLVHARPSATQAVSPTTASAVSADGSTVAFISYASTLVTGDSNRAPDVFAWDRGTGQVERVSVRSGGAQARLGVVDSERGLAISADGQVIAFVSVSPDLVVDDHNAVADVFVHDRRTGVTSRVSVGPDGSDADQGSGAGFGSGVAISADGRLVAFDSDATNLVVGDTNDLADVFVRDRVRNVTTRVSVGVGGEEANGPSRAPALAGDVVAFTSVATNLVPGATRGFGDVFVHELGRGVTSLASVASDGTPADLASSEPALSGDGRFVGFTSLATTLDPDDHNNAADVFVHDRLTGLTQRVSLRFDGTEFVSAPNATASAGNPSLTADGRTALLICTEDLAEGLQAHRAAYARHADPDSPGADLTGDGRIAATVLRVLDLAAPAGSEPRTLCPAEQVAVAGDTAAFLRPESAGDAPGCPPGPVLNDDGDTDDLVVHVADPGGGVRNLEMAATAVAVSAEWIAALVPAPEPGGGGGAAGRLVAAVHPTTGAGGWTSLDTPADQVAVRGAHVVLVTPEAAAGVPLNGDGDLDDRVLQIADAATATVRNLGLAVEDLVAGDTLLAFRTAESVQGDDLNADGDRDDDVLFVLDLASGVVHPTGSAVTPCRFAACDPRLPYRVLGASVRFLTLEADQGEDLDGDGDQDDLVLQTFQVPAAAAPEARSARAAVGRRARRAVAAVAAGRCSTTGEACALDARCGAAGRCIVPPGRCVLDVGTPCRPGDPDDCAPDQFCGTDPDTGAAATCRQPGGQCAAAADCPAGQRCVGEGQQFARLLAPLAREARGGAVLPAVGRCVDEASGREGSPCRVDEECPLGAACREDVLTAAFDDRDGDEVPDPVDVCPDVPDPTQGDLDGDGVGDACDARTAGNGVRDPGEQCDGTDDAACPGQCQPDATCRCDDELTHDAHVRIGARRALRPLTARLQLPLGTYGGERVLVRLDDPAGQPIASGGVASLPAVAAGRLWRARGRGAGLREVRVMRLGASGDYRLDVRARRWIPRDAPPWASLTVTVGDRCFTVRRRRVPETTTTTTTTRPPPASSTSTTSASATTSTSSTTTTTTLPPGECCAAYRMVVETTDGGALRVGGIPPFDLPGGTRLTLDVGPPDGACRHEVRVPRGGFVLPPFCLGGLGWTVALPSVGCAAGDAEGRGSAWDGGAPAPDADIVVRADTSDGACNPPGQACSGMELDAGANALGSDRATIGDGVVDTARGVGLAVEIPVRQKVWDAREAPGQPTLCPDTKSAPFDGEGINGAGTSGMLRLTTGTLTAQFDDANGDGCASVPPGQPSIRGTGAPAAGPCCAVDQSLRLAGSIVTYAPGFLGDVLLTLDLPARVVECQPPPEPAATCDALIGGGRVVTPMHAARDLAAAVLPVSASKVVAVGPVERPPSDGRTVGLARYLPDGRLDPGFGADGTGRSLLPLEAVEEPMGATLDRDGRIVVAGTTADGDDDFLIVRVDADGVLDPSFGAGGRVRLPLLGEDHAYAVVVDGDDRIVVVGSSRAPTEAHDAAVVRLLPDGRLDPAFGAGGVVEIHVDGNDVLRAVAVFPDGSLVVSGRSGGDDQTAFLVGRLTPAGAPDPAFGADGFVRFDLGPSFDEARTASVLPGGDLIVAGLSKIDRDREAGAVAVRLDGRGTPSPAFGEAGFVRFRFNSQTEVNAALLQADGKLVLAGGTRLASAVSPAGEPIEPPWRWFLRRLDPDTGAPDPGFGDGGVVVTSFDGLDDRALSAAVLPDGRLVGAGFYDPNAHYGVKDVDFGLMRFTAEGHLDPSFGGECAWRDEARQQPLGR